jgi:hypothetical protein
LNENIHILFNRGIEQKLIHKNHDDHMKLENKSSQKTVRFPFQFQQNAASSYTSSSGASFSGVGWVFPTPFFAHVMARDASGRKNPCHPLISPDFDDPVAIKTISQKLSLSHHQNTTWKEISETKGETNIQCHHLDFLSTVFPFISTTTPNGTISNVRRTTNTLSKFSLTEGVVSGGSQPDAYLLDANGVVRGIFEVKASSASPIEGLRQAAASAINVACYQVDRGVPARNVVVPFISSNGSQIQFGAVLVLKPCLPYFIPLTGILDLGVPSQRLEIAKIFLRMQKHLEAPLSLRSAKDPRLALREMSNTHYYSKSLDTFSCSQPTVNQSLQYYFEALNELFDKPKCKEFVVFPICILEGDRPALVFRNFAREGYCAGLPSDRALLDDFFQSLETAVREIHKAGIAHMDITEDNILWKRNGNGVGVSIKIVGWDSVHRLGDPCSAEVRDRFKLRVDVASTERDLGCLKSLREKAASSSANVETEDKPTLICGEEIRC